MPCLCQIETFENETPDFGVSTMWIGYSEDFTGRSDWGATLVGVPNELSNRRRATGSETETETVPGHGHSELF